MSCRCGSVLLRNMLTLTLTGKGLFKYDLTLYRVSALLPW